MSSRMQSLKIAPTIPRMIFRKTQIHPHQETFAESFRGLHEILSSVDSGFPFVLEFQSQKLAQDGFLPPNTVIQLLPEIKKMTTRSSAPSVSNHSEVVQPNRIPWESFPGPDTESTDFQLHKLIKSIK